VECNCSLNPSSISGRLYDFQGKNIAGILVTRLIKALNFALTRKDRHWRLALIYEPWFEYLMIVHGFDRCWKMMGAPYWG
jgi:hypothetical protein